MQSTFSEYVNDTIEDLRKELSHTNFTIHQQVLKHRDASLAGLLVCFDFCGDVKVLTKYLFLEASTIAKFDPVLAFKVRNIFNGATETAQEKNF